MKEPVMKVSDISRLLVNLKKNYQKNYQKPQGGWPEAAHLSVAIAVLQDVRMKLELRRRSREFIILPNQKKKKG